MWTAFFCYDITTRTWVSKAQWAKNEENNWGIVLENWRTWRNSWMKRLMQTYSCLTMTVKNLRNHCYKEFGPLSWTVAYRPKTEYGALNISFHFNIQRFNILAVLSGMLNVVYWKVAKKTADNAFTVNKLNTLIGWKKYYILFTLTNRC